MTKIFIYPFLVSSTLILANDSELIEKYSLPKNFFSVDFHKSMSINDNYKKESALTDKNWLKIMENYLEHVIRNPKYSEKPKIPKIIHQIWIGKKPLPERCKKWLKSWKNLHPEWKIILWDDEAIDKFGLINKDVYDENTNYGAKADTARLEIVYRLGGLYTDVDFECLVPFDIFHHICDFYAGARSHNPKAGAMNSLFGASPYHPILKTCVEEIKRTRPVAKPKEEGLSSVPIKTGPEFFSTCIFKAIHQYEGPAVIFPLTFFYPLPYIHSSQREDPKKLQSWIREESFAIHYWGESWGTK